MKAIDIPEDLNAEAEFIRDSIRKAVEKSKVATAEEITLVKPSGKQFSGAEIAPFLLLLGGNATSVAYT
jgi:hypothetical protein